VIEKDREIVARYLDEEFEPTERWRADGEVKIFDGWPSATAVLSRTAESGEVVIASSTAKGR
jgi:hypothetical protein